MMKVVYEGTPYDLEEGQSLLDGLLDHGVEVPFGCRAGTCQSCLLRCIEGSLPEAAQRGLRAPQKLNRLILACQCLPTEGMTVMRPEADLTRHAATVRELRALTSSIVEVSLQPEQAFSYRAGQFVRLDHPGGGSRCYSLASVPAVDDSLTLHVRAYPGGLVSQWVHHELQPGEQVSISDALGECFYIEGRPDQPLLLVGTGTGLAPLYGIVRDALTRGHEAPIHLYHGGRTAKDLYLSRELTALAIAHPQVHYHPCLSQPDETPLSGTHVGRASDLALQAFPDLKGWRVFLCGNPEMVRATQLQAFLAGAMLDEIHADPFDSQATRR